MEPTYFITLTYDDSNLPETKKGLQTLDKSHIPSFIKSIRNGYRGHYIKYFGVGEYGTTTGRPHYHVLLFGVPLPILLINPDIKAVELGIMQLDGKSNFFTKHWEYGHITIGQCNEASVTYTLKYMMKPGKVGDIKGDDRQREFRLMSKGLGAEYIFNEKKKYYHKKALADAYHITIENGKKIPMPRYYKDKLYTDEEKAIIKDMVQDRSIQEAARKASKEVGYKTYRAKKEYQKSQAILMNKDNLQNRNKL